MSMLIQKQVLKRVPCTLTLKCSLLVYSLNMLFFRHNSLPHHAILTNIGGNLPYSLPDLPKPKRVQTNNRKTKQMDPKI